MEIEIIDQPIRFRLHGLSSSVGNQSYGEVGCRLMDEMWKVVMNSATMSGACKRFCFEGLGNGRSW
ncbi:hypothetical protein Pan258_29560 [Symmachiella dynata]|nr:hypothetical protein Pan258_29560 [Symmachiella dynata]